MLRTIGKGTTRTTIKVLPPSHMAKVPNSIISLLSQWIKTSVSTPLQEDWVLQERLSIMAQVHNGKKGIDTVSFVNESLYS
jgi:hypothetical protein